MMRRSIFSAFFTTAQAGLFLFAIMNTTACASSPAPQTARVIIGKCPTTPLGKGGPPIYVDASKVVCTTGKCPKLLPAPKLAKSGPPVVTAPTRFAVSAPPVAASASRVASVASTSGVVCAKTTVVAPKAVATRVRK